MFKISVVIPALNEAEVIVETLQRLQPLRALGHEVIVVDAQSQDETVALAQPLADRVLSGYQGRARQMNAGAAVAEGAILWFLHADTLVPKQCDRLLQHALQDRLWGRFNVRLSGKAWPLRLVERMMNLRSCLSGICTGDQGVFVLHSAFDKVGGFADLPLMEDIALSRSLKRLSWPKCVSATLTTSSRRWEKNGIWRTVFLMWSLRLRYFFGAAPSRLAHRYSVL
ncbi:MAG: TIGR04283 family arsenosugar biosynthesis glycosyltransferase [Gammaproteobacteria bacterium]|nr:TIGR04283 family arsenosugar biosynthesis glycosyltransferase [Gammaproteobacteria bacterium]